MEKQKLQNEMQRDLDQLRELYESEKQTSQSTTEGYQIMARENGSLKVEIEKLKQKVKQMEIKLMEHNDDEDAKNFKIEYFTNLVLQQEMKIQELNNIIE